MHSHNKCYRLSELIDGLEILNPDFTDRNIDSIENDSRLVTPDSLYIAYSGYTGNSHIYIDSAYQNGCRNFVVDSELGKPYAEKYPDGLFLFHRDVKQALSRIAQKYYNFPSRKMTVIGITGTNGKTTTATAVFTVLRKLGYRAGMIGTIEYRINDEVIPATNTTPDLLVLNQLTAKMADEGVRYLVMEISSHSLELGRVMGLELDVAAFTNFTQDHLDFHKTMDNYFAAKMKITDLLHRSSKPEKTFIVNSDMDRAEDAIRYAHQFPEIKTVTYSIRNPHSDHFAEVKEMTPAHTVFTLNGHRFELSMIGKPNVYNFTLASSIMMELGFDPERFIPLMKDIRVPGRLEPVQNRCGFHALIDYAHTHDALENVLTTIREVIHPDGKVITVFGAGGDRDRAKRPLMGRVAVKYSDIVVVTSDNPRTEDPDFIISEIMIGVNEELSKKHADSDVRTEVIVEADRRKAVPIAVKRADTHDVILIAGKGHEDYQIIGKEKQHFSDKEEVLSAIVCLLD